MKIKPLKIGDLIAKLPIIQGGMGVGVSLSNLSQAVSTEGGIGVISAAQIGYQEKDFNTNPLKANIRALSYHIKKAKENTINGIIGVNIMVALRYYEEYIKTAIKAGVDLIISGAGLPKTLPQLVKNTKVKIAPIVSSGRAAKVIFKIWDKKYETAADLVVIEGPRAGGHLGFSLDDVKNNDIKLENILSDVLEEVKPYEEKYKKQIPVVVAGGIYTGFDIARYLKLGASGVQMATRFIGTHECDASKSFKQAFINCKKDDIELVKSPVGMPGRAINNSLVETIKQKNIAVNKCFDCLNPELCDRKTIPYCITDALIKSVSGDINNGLVFCGDNAYRINELVSVAELMNELKEEILAY